MNRDRIYDCVIIGGGVGGLIAALYLKRYKRRVLVFQDGEPRIFMAPRIRNLVGFSKGIAGRSLYKRVQKQISACEIDVRSSRARIVREGKYFKVLSAGETVFSRKLILATGMRDVHPEVENYRQLTNEQVLAYCPICDGFDYSNESIGLLAKDFKGLRKIKFLYQFSPHLTVVYTGQKAIPPIYKKLIRRLKLKLFKGELQALSHEEEPKRLLIKLKGQPQIRVRLAYVALGTKVPTDATRGLRGLKRTSEGFIVTSSHQESSIKGLYAIGDCANGLSQVSVAIGHAAVAATHVHSSLGLVDSAARRRRSRKG